MESPTTPERAPERPVAPSSWSRISQTNIPRPGLPNISGLRTALLGYLGEVEAAVRERLGGEADFASVTDAGSPQPFSDSASLSGSGEDEQQPFASSSTVTSTGHLGISADGLRRRTGGQNSGAVQEGSTSLLNHLSSLREDVSRYLPQRLSVPAPPNLGPRGEWLRNLPYRLRIVDLSVPPSPALGDRPASPTDFGENGAVENARRKVIELVHALLPSEEWAGWERLGWEEQEKDLPPRRHSVDLGRPMDGDDDEEEPEYLFPNRTPASAKAMASRRRAVRSKSLGAAGFSSYLKENGMPRLVRVQTAPVGKGKNAAWPEDEDYEVEDDEDEAVDEEEEELDFAQGVDLETLADLKIGRVLSHQELGPSVAEALAISDDGKKLILYEDLPFIWRNNEHIHTGYRFIPLHAKTGPIPLIRSAFDWHNETVNIHSHFIPTILILLFIPLIIYASPLPDAHPLDTATLVVYLLAAVACLIFSAGWHVMSGCASRKWFEWGACVDYIGISWLIAASFFTVLYNAFYCYPGTVFLYSTVNLVCGLLGSFLPFQKWFNERKHKNWRISFFLFLCFAMFAPMFQMYYEHGWHRSNIFVAPFGLSIMTYVAGLLFYAFHFPECVWPGRFDYWGASHHLWHAAIVGAIILHYRAIFTAHNARYAYSCAMPNAGQPVGELVEEWWWRAVEVLRVGLKLKGT